MNGLINSGFRFVTGLIRIVLDKLWSEPLQIKGAAFTVALYVCIVCAVVIAVAGQIIPLLLGGMAFFVMQLKSKPKKLGRPLPYRRKR